MAAVAVTCGVGLALDVGVAVSTAWGAVWHAADGRINAMLHERDERTMEYKPDVDTLGHLREVGDWDDARPIAERLLGWIVGEGDAK